MFYTAHNVLLTRLPFICQRNMHESIWTKNDQSGRQRVIISLGFLVILFLMLFSLKRKLYRPGKCQQLITFFCYNGSDKC